ncbi:thermonuclease family protein [Cytophaga aurantiaca]|uniref:thermonuclease family protein n=1 Tax=Cytophaga aurantiaca TaxID=29530 RepID=UPI000374A44C|nr:thermonuclease family protein [Cytophaga aurantiaca]
MKKVIFFLAALFSISLAIAQHSAHVIRVIDGDTFIAKWGNKNYTCRLENVDAPELTQNFGTESYRALNNLIMGHKIMISNHKVDLYGRRLVSVTVDTKRVDSLLIRNGFAWLYINYCNEALLKQCMQDAINSKSGLWDCGKEHVCPPWLYRHYNYKSKLKYCTGCK